jgi:Zn-dependent peptidase ImmA (M78 family)/DNA-binding XRE family transcriptional regulator
MVSDESPYVLGERLREARRARGLTQAEAAQHLGVSRPTLIAVEQGRRRPTPTELVTLAELYGRRMHELMRSSPPVEALAASFRLSPGDAKSATDLAVDSLERIVDDVLELEEISGVSLAKNYPPVYDMEGLPIDTAAEQLAVSERHRLGLGDGPVLELRNLLEGEVGLRIFSLPLPAKVAGLFAFSERAGACIGVNAGHPLDRQRWTLAHECAHFLTDRWSAEVTRLSSGSLPSGELFAETFAANFLMPASSLTRRFQAARRSRASTFTAADLLQLASEYQVSAMALAIRLQNLGLLGAGWWDTLESRGFKVMEAQDQLGIARMPQDHELLPQRTKYVAIEAYLNGQMSEGQLARLFKMDRVDTREAVDRLTRSFDTNTDGGVQAWTWTADEA